MSHKRPTLGNTQRKFALTLAKFIVWVNEQGYEVTFGDAYRDPRVFGLMGTRKPGSYGSSKSNHKQRLAVDLNLFRNGKWLPRTEDHAEIGEYWKSMEPECAWGGDFSSKDGNHYSFSFQGLR